MAWPTQAYGAHLLHQVWEDLGLRPRYKHARAYAQHVAAPVRCADEVLEWLAPLRARVRDGSEEWHGMAARPHHGGDEAVDWQACPIQLSGCLFRPCIAVQQQGLGPFGGKRRGEWPGPLCAPQQGRPQLVTVLSARWAQLMMACSAPAHLQAPLPPGAQLRHRRTQLYLPGARVSAAVLGCTHVWLQLPPAADLPRR